MASKPKFITAPDFVLTNAQGRTVRLSDYRGVKQVVLVFSRIFLCAFCRRHLSQLRHEYQRFAERGAEVVVIGPENQLAFHDYWQKEQLPFVGLADPTLSVAKRYAQDYAQLEPGRMPAVLVIDRQGQVRYQHFGHTTQDIPPNQMLFSVLDKLNRE